MNLRLPSSLLFFILPAACMRSGNAPSVQDPYDKAFESIDEVQRLDFIKDLEHSNHQRPDPKRLYLRLFGRFDNREEFVASRYLPLATRSREETLLPFALSCLLLSRVSLRDAGVCGILVDRGGRSWLPPVSGLHR